MKFKFKIRDVNPWNFIVVSIVFQILANINILRIGWLNLTPIVTVFSMVSLLAAIILTFNIHFKGIERSVINAIYKICMYSGVIILFIIGNFMNVPLGIANLIVLICGGERAWDVCVVIYCILLTISAAMLLVAFVIKLIQNICRKSETGKRGKAFLITGYAIFAAVVILFSVIAVNAMRIDFDWNILEIVCILEIFAPIFIALILAFLLIQKRAKTE